MHPALYGAYRHATALSRNQDQGFTIFWRKSCKRRAHVLEVTRRTLIRGCAKLSRIGAVGVRNFVLGPPVLAVEEVAQDREQPRAHAGARLELLDVG